ncbi:hypothetical protein [Lentzea sp. NPDC051838]|uniref:hypothetical protein n=1 Tax=Lentzea sp. NPDC051838 TaxID=3154849 RepID=UPI0034460D25
MSTRRLPGIVLAALIISGCGSGPSASTGTTTGNGTGGQAKDAGAKYTECMKSAGWNPEQLGGAQATGLPKDPKFEADVQRCQRESGLDKARPKEDGKPDAAKQNERTLALVRCLRDRGWQVADPKTDSRGVLLPPPPEENLPADKQSAYNTDFNQCVEKTQGGAIEGRPEPTK